MPRPFQRHRLRFGISSLLAVVTVFGVWLGWHVRQVNMQKQAVAWVEATGGHVHYDFECDDKGWIPDAEVTVPDWLCRLIGVDHFASVAVVSLGDVGVKPDLSPLYALQNLRTIFLWDPYFRVSEVDLASLKENLPDCEVLPRDVEYERVFDRAVENAVGQ